MIDQSRNWICHWKLSFGSKCL